MAFHRERADGGEAVATSASAMSTFAVENSGANPQMRFGSGPAPDHWEIEMRIVETGVAGVVAIASQILIFATVLI